MTRLHHDEFAKGFLESLLSPFGQVQTSFKISAEVREIDVYFQHDATIQPIPELGLLGKLAQTEKPSRSSRCTLLAGKFKGYTGS
jgi:hypothetical protein